MDYYNQHDENEEGEEYVENDNNGEEMNFEDENEGENIEEPAEERDSLHKTLTQNIGEDVIQIPEQQIYFYHQPENFCDYKP